MLLWKFCCCQIFYHVFFLQPIRKGVIHFRANWRNKVAELHNSETSTLAPRQTKCRMTILQAPLKWRKNHWLATLILGIVVQFKLLRQKHVEPV